MTGRKTVRARMTTAAVLLYYLAGCLLFAFSQSPPTPSAPTERQTTLTAVASPSTTGTLNVYRRNAACSVQQQFKLVASGVAGTTDPAANTTTFTYADYKVSPNQTYCYYVTVSGGGTAYPQSQRYQAVFTTQTVVFQ